MSLYGDVLYIGWVKKGGMILMTVLQDNNEGLSNEVTKFEFVSVCEMNTVILFFLMCRKRKVRQHL